MDGARFGVSGSGQRSRITAMCSGEEAFYPYGK
jgi:hypothetical protein